MQLDLQSENQNVWPKIGMACLARTRPIFVSKGGADDLRALGSCFFLRYLDRYFLVTAAHVATESGEHYTRVHGRPGALAPDRINGTFHFIGKPGMQPGTDSTDLAFVELDSTHATLARETYFAPGDWTEDDPITPQSVYLACGWPSELNDPCSIFPGEPQSQKHIAFFNSSIPAASYANHRLDPTSHYAIEHERRQVVLAGGLQESPKVPGMSGSPLIFVHRYATREDWLRPRSPKLVGIVIEHAPAGKFLVATRIKILLAGIRAYVAGASNQTLFQA
jgi:hypothetical protein